MIVSGREMFVIEFCGRSLNMRVEMCLSCVFEKNEIIQIRWDE